MEWLQIWTGLNFHWPSWLPKRTGSKIKLRQRYFWLVCFGLGLVFLVFFQTTISKSTSRLMKHLYLQYVVASKRHQLIESPPVMQETQIPGLNKMVTEDTPNYKYLCYLLNCHRILEKLYERDKKQHDFFPGSVIQFSGLRDIQIRKSLKYCGISHLQHNPSYSIRILKAWIAHCWQIDNKKRCFCNSDPKAVNLPVPSML